ncbi:MAG: arylesterase [Bradymonadales bacterium]|nr:MAG: arylesterase [Bradymonadales bacterium]
MLWVLLSLFLAQHPTAEQPKTLMFLGDSLTAGYGLLPGQGFPEQLQTMLSETGVSVRIVNGGVSGDTTAGGLRRLPWMLSQIRPDALIVALGANDMLRGLPIESTEANLRAIISLANEKAVPVFVLGVEAAPNLGEDFVQGFRRIFRRLSDISGVFVMPNFISSVVGQPEFNLRDGIHPNVKGQRRIAEDVLNFLKEHWGEEWSRD